MNCEEVSKHLTEYLDKTLDTAMTTRVATHVISCALCRAESKELADCVRQVASLPVLDAPLGFAQRVMAHVREMEPKPTLWQRLMAPLTSRMPVQATAVALVAIGAIALYQKEQPLKQNSGVNLALRSDSQTQTEPARTSAAPTTAFKDRATAATKPAPAQVAQATNTADASRAGSSGAAPAQQAKATGDNLGEETFVAPKRPPLRVQEVTTFRDNDAMFGGPRGFGAPLPAGLNPLRPSAMRQAPMALERATPIGDRVADFEFVVRRRSPQHRDQIDNASSADGAQKSNEAESPSPAATRPSTPPAARAKIESIAEFRFYNVAPGDFESFKKELAAEANIESEPKATVAEVEAAKAADRQLLIKVTILPAEVSSR